MANLAGIVLGPLINLIDKVVPNREEADRIKADLEKGMLENEAILIEIAAEMAKGDAQSDSWMSKNARPATVFTMLGLLVTFFSVAIVDPDRGYLIAEALEQVPTIIWGLIGGGVGLYQVARPLSQFAQRPREGQGL